MTERTVEEPDPISSRELRARLGGPRPPMLLDVRDPEELSGENGFIPGALNIPLAELPARLRELAAREDAEIVTICNTGRPGGRAAAAAGLLAGSGFRRVRRLEDGIVGWNGLARTSGRAVTKAAGRRPRTVAGRRPG